ncbi:MAG: tRNA-dihydrouridine synthase family protein, partial [Verrucomicrobiales bacterium]|nr:tRNA-dihydrouridine synthase family protein [Verrucomicrobiales bacterium]
IEIPFTVKTRIGFDDPQHFDKILEIFARHPIDLLAVHGRTVADRYRPGVRYDLIRTAAEAMSCPVLANGDVTSPAGALEIWKDTATRGLMLGRGAVRNPWLFQQIRQAFAGETPTLPPGREVLRYIESLFDTVTDPDYTELERVHRVKKHLNFLGTGIDAEGLFLHQMRRTTSRAELSRVAADFLDHDQPVALEPVAAPEAART